MPNENTIIEEEKIDEEGNVVKGEIYEQVFTKATPTLWTLNYLLVWFSSLALFFAFNSMVPTLPIYMELYGNIAGAAGFPLAALTIGAVLSRPFAGWSIDVYGRRIVFFGGIILFLLPCAVFIAMIPATLLIVFRFIQGVGWGFCNTAVNTIASDNVPLHRMGEGLGFFTLTTSIGMLTAPALGLWILDNYSFPVFFYLITLVTIFSIIPMLFVKMHSIPKKIERSGLVFMDRAGLKPAVVMLLYCISNSAAMSFLSVYAILQGVANSWIFYSIFPLGSILFRPFFGILLDRRGSKGYDMVVTMGIIAHVLAVLVLARTSSLAHLVIGGCFFGFGFGAVQLSMFTDTIRKISSEKRGSANATFWTAFDIGIGAGSILWGPVAAMCGYAVMFNLAAIPACAALIVYFLKVKI